MKRFMMAAFAAMMVFGLASCGKDDENTPTNNNQGGGTESLAGTSWIAIDGNILSGNYTAHGLEFSSDNLCAFGTYVGTPASEEPEVTDFCIGTYTYASGAGTIHFTDTTGTIDKGDATFTVSGNTLTLVYNGESFVLTKEGAPDPDPQPGDGGDINGTTWMYTYTVPTTDPDEEDITIMHNLTFTYGYCIYTFNDENYATYQYTGSYTFSNGRGSASLADEDGATHDATFSVSGNTMTFICDGNTLTFEKQVY